MHKRWKLLSDSVCLACFRIPCLPPATGLDITNHHHANPQCLNVAFLPATQITCGTRRPSVTWFCAFRPRREQALVRVLFSSFWMCALCCVSEPGSEHFFFQSCRPAMFPSHIAVFLLCKPLTNLFLVVIYVSVHLWVCVCVCVCARTHAHIPWITLQDKFLCHANIPLLLFRTVLCSFLILFCFCFSSSSSVVSCLFRSRFF